MDYMILYGKEKSMLQILSKRREHHIKFEFINTEILQEGCNILEFLIHFNGFTQALFLKVIDYSKTSDERDLRKLWDNLIRRLKRTMDI